MEVPGSRRQWVNISKFQKLLCVCGDVIVANQHSLSFHLMQSFLTWDTWTSRRSVEEFWEAEWGGGVVLGPVDGLGSVKKILASSLFYLLLIFVF